MFDGHLIATYGDYGANTGPIDVVSTPLASPGVFTSEVTLHTEETWALRTLSAGLCVPYVDPQGFEDATQGQYATATASGSWTVHTNVDPVPIHVFDAVECPDGLFLFGASNNSGPDGGGTVWRSTDGGATWTVSLDVPDASGLGRFYAAVRLGADMLAVFDNGTARTLYHWPTGGPWAAVGATRTVSDLVPFTWQGTPFALGVPVGKQFGHTSFDNAVVLTLPAVADQQAAIAASLPTGVQVRDAVTDGTHLWILDANSVVWQGATDGTWTALFQLTRDVRSLAVTDTAFFFGTGDSRIVTTAR